MASKLRSPTGRFVAKLAADGDDPGRNSDSLLTDSSADPVSPAAAAAVAAAVELRWEFGSTDARFGIDAVTDARDAAAVLAVEKKTAEAATALAALSVLVVSSISGLLKAML